MNNIKNIFVNKIETNALLLLLLVFILIVCLIYIDDITLYLNNKLNNKKQLNDINVNEGFETNKVINVKTDIKADTVMGKIYERNYSTIINPKTKSIKLSFNKVQQNELDDGINELGYLIVLAKYNNLLQKVGHVNAKISNEGINIENYLNKYNNIFPNDEDKDKIRNIIKNINNTNTLSLTILNIFNNNDTNMNLNKLKTDTQDNTTAFFELLSIVYDARFVDKALNIQSSNIYNSSIIDLYNDLYLLDTQNLPKLDTLIEQRHTPITFKNNINIEDTKFELIVQNKQDSKLINNEISNITSKLNSNLLDFLYKYLNKYENLSISNDNKINDGICSRDGICTYTFENLEDKDINGNHYYYKLGIALIYNKGISTYVEEISRIHTYKFGANGRLMYFKLDNSLEEQEKLLKRLEEIEKNSLKSIINKPQNIQQLPNDKQNTTNNDVDAYMKLLRPHIGNYPDEFTLNEQDIRDFSLSDYLNKSVNLGQINLNVNIADDPQYPPTE